ncbi:hypothetical protein BJY01DRAFT_204351 [Aspergillus pseudoustus]|uniref:Uncharacterized protein n=1 Tax=Aspergillus pseudoustus TaxID=1810923 RepID=A0ABR4KTB2_9EURO
MRGETIKRIPLLQQARMTSSEPQAANYQPPLSVLHHGKMATSMVFAPKGRHSAEPTPPEFL